MTEQQEWKAYLERYIKAYNALPEVPPLLKTIAPLVFNYQITDRPEMSYWFLIKEDKISWGIGDYQGPSIPTVVHKTDFETMKQVNSGESDPIQATMSGTYVIEGDVAKLMACAPLIPLSAKAHAGTMKGH
ncbi:MAG TPA: SCP2 sterol-binding domain-containing protein [Candidatus Deferrimicrobium sp.]|nr:SCP2 sterol-binding domain-containing protein [Candidatus Deferrimicrobium sp.]